VKTITKLWFLIAVLAALTPLGLALPEYFKAGSSWGEWGLDEIKGLIGYLPQGLGKLASIWNPPIPDYSFKGWSGKALLSQGFAYISSAVLGILVTAGVVILLGKFFKPKE
jgi:cobalt/nickel transport protein